MSEWIIDSGMTPHIIAADHPDLVVPDAARQDGKVVLNISATAVRDLLIDAEMLSFVARFGGVSQAVSVPMEAVQAIYARENGRGMMFPEDDAEGDDGETLDDSGQSGQPPGKQSKKSATKAPNLRVVK